MGEADTLEARGPDGGRGPEPGAGETPPEARLEALARPDKWYLSAGDGALWAPPFPRHLDRPGFWDPAHVAHYPVGPLFTVALVDARGREIPLAPDGRRWRPDHLTCRWRTPAGDLLEEARAVLPGGRFCSWWRAGGEGWRSPGLAGAHLVAFTLWPDGPDVEPPVAVEGGLARSFLAEHRDHGARLTIAITAAGDVRRCALRAEGPALPDWSLTPFPELWSEERGLPESWALAGRSRRGHVHAALALRVPEEAGERVAFTATVGTPGWFGEGPHEEPGAAPAPEASTRRWSAPLSSFPSFRCSDAFLERYFDYRVYGLFLNRLEASPAGYRHAAVAEGPETFHLPITYSAQCHMMETRWGDPAAARGSLLNFLDAQRADGWLPGRLHLGERRPGAPPELDFYHASWGDAALAVDAVHPDEAFLARAYHGLSLYAGWLARARDPEESGMITVVNHYETGQEYMSRYVVVDPDADTTEWEPRLALKGIDVTVYAYQLERSLATMARRLGAEHEADAWQRAAERRGEAILGPMWDEEGGLFSDVDAATGERTGVEAAVCFYPLLTDLLEERHVARLLGHLTDPGSFATPWPVPSSSADDPLFSAAGLWKGKRMNCPWNGRVWPMTDAHLVEGLLRQWRAGRREAGPVAAHLLRRFVHMMFDGGRLDRPNCFEHYNPFTGSPSRFRGIDDYQHSWVLDLLVRGVAGLEVGEAGVVVDPLPIGVERVRLGACRARARQLGVTIEGGDVTLEIDGERHRGTRGTPLEVGW